VLGNVNAEYFANIQDNTALIYNNENSGFATIRSNVTLIANTVNVLGQIRRATDGTAPNNLNTTIWSTNTSLPVGSYVVYNANTYVTTGNVYGYNVPWRANTVLASNSYFFYSGNVYQVSSNVGANLYATNFASVRANANVIYTGRTDSGFASISSNLSLLYAGTNRLRHLTNSRVVDASQEQVVPGITIANTKIVSTTEINTTTNVSIKLTLSGNITANVGDYILTNIANLRLLETVTTDSKLAAIQLSGNIFAGISNAVAVVDRVTGNVSSTEANITQATVLGQVTTAGNVQLLANTYVTQTTIWYGNITDYFYSDTLNNSTTAQATFLKASPGYTP
jgi:hypothetical protein